MSNRYSDRELSSAATGIVFILSGILFNEWLLGRFLYSGAALSTGKRLRILLVELALIGTGAILIRFRKSIRRWQVVLACAALTIFFLETFFYFLNYKITKRITYEGNITEGFSQYDPVLGYKVSPGKEFLSVKKAYGKKIYEVTYSFDKFSRRITPVNGEDGRDNFMLFFGDSFTFGEGVRADETLPARLAYILTPYRPYNYGLCGYGPQEMLAKLQTGDIKNEVNEPRGALIYVFIDDHIRRANGSMYIYLYWGKDMPCYVIDRSGNLVKKGSFTSARPVLSFIYRSLFKSQTVRYLINHGLDLPPFVTDSQTRLTCGIIEASRDEFKKKFKSDDFYVVFFPGSRHAKKMIARLENAKIKCLDYSRLIDMSDSRFFLSRYDKHPTPMAYDIVAENLGADLLKK